MAQTAPSTMKGAEHILDRVTRALAAYLGPAYGGEGAYAVLRGDPEATRAAVAALRRDLDLVARGLGLRDRARTTTIRVIGPRDRDFYALRRGPRPSFSDFMAWDDSPGGPCDFWADS